jgi:hypothetical protein
MIQLTGMLAAAWEVQAFYRNLKELCFGIIDSGDTAPAAPELTV